MEFLRRAVNPWGREVLVGIGWDLMWVALAAGALFVLAHAALAARARRAARFGPAAGPATPPAGGLPVRIVRHELGSRLFHWGMAAAMFALLITAFVPVMGLQFDWVAIHWVAGLALIATVAFHVAHVIVRRSGRTIWAGAGDLRAGTRELGRFVGRRAGPPDKPGKYPVAQKLFHHVATLAALAAIATGLLMMVRIETPLFRRDPYLLDDGSWGLVYVMHGLAGVGLIGLVIAHVYFAARPEKRWLSRAMLKGWITREEYLEHHDPARWPVGPAEPERTSLPAEPASSQPG